MVVVGADVHKRTHTFVAVDAVGKRVGEKVVAATSAGHAQALRWARERFGAELIWESRIVGICRRGWSAIYSAPVSRSCECRQS